MIRRLFFGQYLHRESIIHNLDPRLKVVYAISLSFTLFLSDKFSEMLIFSAFVFAVMLLTKVDIPYFIRNLAPFRLVFVFILVMYIVFSPSQIQQGLVAVWRFLILIFLSSVLTFTTTIQELVNAIERLAKPLKSIGIKPRNVATMISVAIRFLPVMFLQFERQKDAMLARLANFRKFKHIRLVVESLLERMLRSAYLLTEAMQSRLYNENARSHRRLRMKMQDYASILLVLVFTAVIY